jgi:hypothetical protein
MAGGASLSVQADQQYYPPLSLTNAVIGQPVPRLEELKRQFDEPTLRQLAEDRSARSRTLTLTYTKPLSDRWTAQLDLHPREHRPHAGVGRGRGDSRQRHRIYGGGQLVGNGIFLPGDTLITGLRYASTERFHIVDGEIAARVPLGSKFAIEPRCGSRGAPTSSGRATRPRGGPICAAPTRRRAGSRSMPRSGWSISGSARTTPRSSARTASARRCSTSAIGCRSSPER